MKIIAVYASVSITKDEGIEKCCKGLEKILQTKSLYVLTLNDIKMKFAPDRMMKIMLKNITQV